MSSLDDIQDLAAALHGRREDWDLVPTLNYLVPHRAIPIEQLWPAAVAWAENPKNRTPASLQYLRIEPRESPESSSSPTRTSKEPRCYICGNHRSDCEKAHEFEVAHGIPDPHDFETKEQALANRSDRQWPDLIADINRLRAERAKERADRARAEIRPTIATGGEGPRIGPAELDQPRKCAGCGGTLSRDEHDTHPGCVRQPDQQETPA